MKAKDLIKALQHLDPEADVVINVKQWNKVYGKQLKINYGAAYKGKDEYQYLNTWVNNNYGGAITVHLPEGAYIAGWPKNML